MLKKGSEGDEDFPKGACLSVVTKRQHPTPYRRYTRVDEAGIVARGFVIVFQEGCWWRCRGSSALVCLLQASSPLYERFLMSSFLSMLPLCPFLFAVASKLFTFVDGDDTTCERAPRRHATYSFRSGASALSGSPVR